jgi:putative mRNA 3-end processing factor
MQHRLGADARIDTMNYGETRQIGDATVSFHPAGHVPGSAQIRVCVNGEIWVASGDYKTVDDGLSEPFEPVTCHAFITESTFGLPVFRWTAQDVLAQELNTWWAANVAAGRPSVLGAYALGKAQRLMRTVNPDIGPILTVTAIENTNQVLRTQGITLPDTVRITEDVSAKTHPGALIIATPGSTSQHWARRFPQASSAFASGWMAMRGVRRRRGADRGFIVSDHADWDGLNMAVKATGAERVFVTHGYTAQFARHLCDQGYDAQVVATNYAGDDVEGAE